MHTEYSEWHECSSETYPGAPLKRARGRANLEAFTMHEAALLHYPGTFDNWDASMADPPAPSGRGVMGRSTGNAGASMASMATEALAFLAWMDLVC